MTRYTDDELRTNRDLSPFQGPDLFGDKTLKIWGHNADSLSHSENERWKPFKIKPWKPTKTSKPSAHVEMSQRVFHSDEGFEFIFWALAPTMPGVRRWNSKWKEAEFVWLVLEGTNGRGVHHALVDKETDEVYWFEKAAAHFQEVAA